MRKHKIISLFLIVPLVAGLVWMAYLYLSVSPWLNFQPYKPMYLVDGRHITDDQRLSLYADNQLVWFRPKSVQIQVGLTGYNLSSWISESKEDPAVQRACRAGCAEKTTPLGQSYLYITDEGDKSWTRDISFAKGGTRIRIKMYGKEIPSIPDEEWSRMVDSFQAKDFDKLRMNHLTPGP